MTSTVIDSTVFRHIFSSEPMRQVFSDEHRVQCYLDIEAALARVQARLGLIPQRAADEIAVRCTLDIIDMAKLKTQTELIGYPVLGVVQQLVAACADDRIASPKSSFLLFKQTFSFDSALASSPRTRLCSSALEQ